jgi:o-succinylbenzoate synthase
MEPSVVRITALSATRFSLPFRDPFPTAAGVLTHRHGFVIRLETDTGIVGIGEASPHPTVAAASLAEIEVALERIRPRVLDAPLGTLAPSAAGDVRRASKAIDHWLYELRPEIPPTLACALEVAAYDATARLHGVSLAHLIGEPCRSQVVVNATLGGTTLAEVTASAISARERGFRCAKLKVGMGPSRAAEQERVAVARRALGPDMHLRLDANGAWSSSMAIEMLRVLQDYDLELVEQPVAPGNLPAMHHVRQAVDVPIAADEDVTSVDAARRVLAEDAASVLVIKPMVVGGLTRARRIADLAREHGAGAIVTTTIDSGIGTAAALQLAATLPDTGLAFGLATADLLDADIVEQPLVVRHGDMAVPAGPGLGVALDDQALARWTPDRS